MAKKEELSDAELEAATAPDVTETKVETPVTTTTQAPRFEYKGTKDAELVNRPTTPDFTPSTEKRPDVIALRNALNIYTDRMRLGARQTPQSLKENAHRLYNAIRAAVNTEEDEGFLAMMPIIITTFKEHSDTVFHGSNVTRGLTDMDVAEKILIDFTKLLLLLCKMTSPNAKQTLGQLTDINKSLGLITKQKHQERFRGLLVRVVGLD